MQIEYKSKKIEKVCTNISEAEKKYGKEMAEKIHLRINQMSAIWSVDMMLESRLGRCHALKGNRKNQYAVDLVHPFRLIFEKKGSEIQIATIVEVTDYHN